MTYPDHADLAAAEAVRNLVIGVSPCGELDSSPRIGHAVARGGGIGVLDLAGEVQAIRAGLKSAAAWATSSFGVRVSPGCEVTVAELDRLGAGRVELIILAGDSPWTIKQVNRRFRVLVEVTGRADALAAAAAGAHGLITRGSESGGRAADLSTFVLLQQLLEQENLSLPIWAAGGIGPRTAAACVLGGAAGVVLDTQLSLMPESDLPEDVLAMLRRPDTLSVTEREGLRGVLRHRPQRPGELLMIGDDAWLAADFAGRWPDTATAVRAIRAAVLEAITPVDADTAPLPSLATTLGVRHSIAQGPMTRVSDQAAFAAAVAAEGGLPFIALALADRQRSQEMLHDAQTTLAGRPWGVGILGFAPEELRKAQIAAILAAKPHCAIVAGGRPVQVRELERAGISTFLHVPSAELLRQFLRVGNRRFVFEGAECGGHIGPRTSFSLWEAQLRVLEEHCNHEPAAAEELQIFFAGGIQDARSSAMVAAMVAPLARRGARCGVLMGTAYLFTDEAVQHGAIRPLFQQKMVDAETTTLLETAPGHVTRCLPTNFVDEFDRTRRRLQAEGIDHREIWQRLELLNAGRLRLASKGLRRDGERLVAVMEPEQDAEGLYMAGQVAVLRDATTTVANLHREVSEGADDFRVSRGIALGPIVAAAAKAEPAAEPSTPLDIAIIGMACAFAGSNDVESYWHTVLMGTDVITEVSPQRWDPAIYFDDSSGANGSNGEPRSTSKWGGFLAPIDIDPIGFGIPPSALPSIDPSQLLALESAARALSDAGYAHDALDADHTRTGVIFAGQLGGDVTNAVMLRASLPSYLGHVPAKIGEQLPVYSEDTFAGILPNVIAGRIANRLNLGGTNFTVDAACAASLAAVDTACKQLTTGSADLILCGGVDLHNTITDFLMFSSVQALSPTGRARTFDHTADGTVLGEGVACVTLKRLADAERDGDRIYAVIKGIGAASDGRARGLTAPRPAGQRRALHRAYRQAGVSPREVGLIEAHGTGTVVGDLCELESLTEVFSDAGADPGGCVLGSVKSQIGHTKSAAGLAGLIKATLAVHTGVQVPTGGLTRPNQAWDAGRSPFAFLTAPRPWVAAADRRIAGVSAFGFGGTNFHVVLSGYAGTPEPRHALGLWPAELFCFGGTDRTAAHRAMQAMLDQLSTTGQAGRRPALRDRAARLAGQASAAGGPVHVAIVAEDDADLERLLRRGLLGEHDPDAGLVQPEPPAHIADQAGVTDRPVVAFLFPGQGSQRPGAMADLFVAFPELRQYLELGPRWVERLFPAAAFDAEGERAQADRVRDTTVAQPVLGMGALAAHHLLGRVGVRPDLVAGHSYGELVALGVAGAFTAETLIELSHQRAEAISATVTGTDAGTMAAVGAGVQDVNQALVRAGLGDSVVTANHNAPEQTVIAGASAAMSAAVSTLRAAGLPVRKLPVACAFHSPLVAAAGDRFGELVGQAAVSAPTIAVWSNRTARPYPTDPDQIRVELAAQIGAPVLFHEQVEAMYAAGARVFVEAGPGRALSRLVAAVLGDRPHLSVGCDDPGRGGLRSLLLALAQLACARVPVDTGWLFHGRANSLPGTAERDVRPHWTTDGQLIRDSAGNCVPGGLTPPRQIEEFSVLSSDRSRASSPGPDREAALADFLRVSREMVAAQRDVMLAFLGDSPAGRPAWQPETVPGGTIAAAESIAAPTQQPDLEGVVLAVISERTGYPIHLIDLDLDLESDLSIDSIKRAEVAGEVAIRLELTAGDDESQFEELVLARTVREMLTLLNRRSGEDERMAGTAEPVEPPSAGPAVAVGVRPDRFLSELVPIDDSIVDVSPVAGLRFAVTGPDQARQQLAEKLHHYGASTIPIDLKTSAEEWLPLADGLILLDGLGLDRADARLPTTAFPLVKLALTKGVSYLLAVGNSGPSSDGLAGMFRTIAREYPDIWSRFVDLGQFAIDPAQILVDRIVAELTRHGPAVVVYRDDVRCEVRHVPAPLNLPDGASGTPLLTQDSVLVLIGGGRGITATVALELAERTGCQIELAGRTPVPELPEDAATASAADLIGVRAALAAHSAGTPAGPIRPAAIEEHAQAVMAGRELTATLSQLRRRGARVRYHQLDVRDHEAVRSLLAALHQEHSRIDGLIFAAGRIEDGLIATKDPASFARVYDVKATAAQSLLEELSEQGQMPGFVVLFGSVAAAYGSRGQCDYAAANDALARIGARWSDRTGVRCLTVHWGPWSPTGEHPGMVSAQLSREYQRRGIETIDPCLGAGGLLDELTWGDPTVTSVVYTAADSGLERMSGPAVARSR